ncbi:uroporphyrinogen-III C-methyltransferase [Malassezia psittaci]|uniref:precorrin-2 dehydrogenase n=1 Tax=Malassezia psittaci TaxID=1821823 RepID=A0AAF0FCN5_9BASI|nr:uroporphyrinogen-III C-methyltransferase [Malassezia psittaci]
MDAASAGAAGSLLLAHRPENKALLVIGDGKVAVTRVNAAHEAGLRVIVVWHGELQSSHAELQKIVKEDEWYTIDQQTLFPAPEQRGSCQERFLQMFEELDIDANLFAVCVTDTLAPGGDDHCKLQRMARCEILVRMCRSRRLPVNVTDQPDLCDFSFPATHRFSSTPPNQSSPIPSSLQFAVTTNGRGCRLAGRIRRTIVASLPANVGDAVERVGDMRDLAKQLEPSARAAGEQEEDPSFTDALGYSEKRAEVQHRRMKWVAQISEYWPLERLANLGQAEIHELLAAQQSSATSTPTHTRPGTPSIPDEPVQKKSRHDLHLKRQAKPGHIYLLGSGPGHPGLLTVAAHHVLTSPDTDLILSDKLVPTAVLSLIPSSTPLIIAKKFPGNAEGAQSELIAQALHAAHQGKIVVRLKQGDPYVYGRGGEEWLAFRKEGFECTVVPGISSALAGPLLMNIPVTQRGAADSLILCTGVGRGGRKVSLPGYERNRTLLILMGVARLRAMVQALTQPDSDLTPFPGYVPIAVVERASSQDQRVIATTLDQIVDVMENKIPDGPRPPSMMVVGWAVLSLAGEVAGNGVTDDEEHCIATYAADQRAAQLAILDKQRISRWLNQRTFLMHEGITQGYKDLENFLPTHNRDLGDRSESGWAAPRYTNQPTHGWTPAEQSSQSIDPTPKASDA